MNEGMFDFDSGALCLDFANSVDWHGSEQPKDRLKEISDLIAWGLAAGLSQPAKATQLQMLAAGQPEEARIAYERAIALREVIYRIFSGFSGKGMVEAADLALLNDALSESLSHLQVAPSEEGFAWDWAERPASFDQLLWPVARSAGELLTSDKLDRVRECADDRGCGYLFVDTSRNRSRRWCSMESCGNRAKAQRHYKRQRSN